MFTKCYCLVGPSPSPAHTRNLDKLRANKDCKTNQGHRRIRCVVPEVGIRSSQRFDVRLPASIKVKNVSVVEVAPPGWPRVNEESPPAATVYMEMEPPGRNLAAGN